MVDQVVEHGVVENGPPAAQVGGMAADAEIGGVDPLRRDGGLGGSVVGPHLEAVLNVVRETRASAQAKRSGCKAGQGGCVDRHAAWQYSASQIRAGGQKNHNRFRDYHRQIPCNPEIGKVWRAKAA